MRFLQSESQKVSRENPLRQIRIEKVTVNIATGKSGEPLEKAKKVLNQLTNRTPATKRAKKTVKEFGIRKGEPIAAVVTLRRENASSFLSRALDAISNKVKESSFDDYGNFSFGIKEHIDIPGVKYDPQVGILGLDVAISLARPGFNIRFRSKHKASVGRHHRITSEEAKAFLTKEFGIEVV